VILPTTTFVATAEVVTYFNAIPVLCDIEYDTHNIDVSKIEALITSKTKVIIPVHFAGQPCDMDEIAAIAKKHNLKVIEDAAHALPSTYNNKKIGTLSDVTCFSFYATKTLTTGEGGMLTTNNDDIAKSVKINRLHGIDRDAWDRYSEKGSWFYEVVDIGFKYNSTDINAAIGLVQLQKLNEMKNKREKIAIQYSKLLDVEGLKIKPNRDTSHHLYVIKTENRDALYDHLKEKGIGTSVHFIPIHHHPYYKSTFSLKGDDYPVANNVFEKSLSLPIYPGLSEDEVGYITDTISNFS